MSQDWADKIAQQILSRSLIQKGICLILGAADTGKTTVAAALAQRLAKHQPIGIIDADIGELALPFEILVPRAKFVPERFQLRPALNMPPHFIPAGFRIHTAGENMGRDQLLTFVTGIDGDYIEFFDGLIANRNTSDCDLVAMNENTPTRMISRFTLPIRLVGIVYPN